MASATTDITGYSVSKFVKGENNICGQQITEVGAECKSDIIRLTHYRNKQAQLMLSIQNSGAALTAINVYEDTSPDGDGSELSDAITLDDLFEDGGIGAATLGDGKNVNLRYKHDVFPSAIQLGFTSGSSTTVIFYAVMG